MEIRVLQYFLAVAREQSILKAAQSLHLSQPTLSRQLKDLEDTLGKQLFIRGSRKITLTEEGMLLRKRAEEIVSLVQKAEEEIAASDTEITGDVTIGAGETHGLRFLARAARKVQELYPAVRFHIHSGDDVDVREDLDRGLIDFALLFGAMDDPRYDSLLLPDTDWFGVFMRKDDPLATREIIRPEDLSDKPLILSRGIMQDRMGEGLLGKPVEELHIAATYSLLYNGSLLAAEGIGYLLGFDKILHLTEESELCFRPFSSAAPIPMVLVWKRYQVMTKAATQFLQQVQALLQK